MTRQEGGASSSDCPDPARAAAETEPHGELDELGASFLCRTMLGPLGLDTDSDYEDEEPSQMPGFVNEPAYSAVYETLMDKTPEKYATMVAALPNFVELLHNDLQAIAARVGHERGLEDTSGVAEGGGGDTGGQNEMRLTPVQGPPAPRSQMTWDQRLRTQRWWKWRLKQMQSNPSWYKLKQSLRGRTRLRRYSATQPTRTS